MITTVVNPQHKGKRESEKNLSLAPQKLPSHEGRQKKEQRNGGLTNNQLTTDKVIEVDLCLSANLNVNELNAPIQRHRTNNKKQGPAKCCQQQTHFKNNIPGAVER